MRQGKNQEIRSDEKHFWNVATPIRKKERVALNTWHLSGTHLMCSTTKSSQNLSWSRNSSSRSSHSTPSKLVVLKVQSPPQNSIFVITVHKTRAGRTSPLNCLLLLIAPAKRVGVVCGASRGSPWD